MDLFCGTGAVGLEAASRGAAEVWLVDRIRRRWRSRPPTSPASAARPTVRVVARDATRLGPGRQGFDLVFLDPPYRSGLAAPALTGLAAGWLAPGARVIVELAAREALSLPDGYGLEQERRYGAARFVFLRPVG